MVWRAGEGDTQAGMLWRGGEYDVCLKLLSSLWSLLGWLSVEKRLVSDGIHHIDEVLPRLVDKFFEKQHLSKWRREVEVKGGGCGKGKGEEVEGKGDGGGADGGGKVQGRGGGGGEGRRWSSWRTEVVGL